MTNEQLYENALDAIDALFGDQTVSESKARENLEDLKDQIDTRLNSLEDNE